MAKLYGIFTQENGRTVWGMVHHKRKAIAYIRVRMLEDVPEITAYDSRTFKVLSEPIFTNNRTHPDEPRR